MRKEVGEMCSVEKFCIFLVFGQQQYKELQWFHLVEFLQNQNLYLILNNLNSSSNMIQHSNQKCLVYWCNDVEQFSVYYSAKSDPHISFTTDLYTHCQAELRHQLKRKYSAAESWDSWLNIQMPFSFWLYVISSDLKNCHVIQFMSNVHLFLNHHASSTLFTSACEI